MDKPTLLHTVLVLESAPHNQVLSSLDKLLRKNSNFIKQQAYDDSDNSCRWIQGNRVEMFVEVEGKPSTLFDRLMADGIGQEGKQEILHACKVLAEKDPRVARVQCCFGNFSLLLSYGRVKPQAAHIDLLYPQYQFGLVVSKEVAPTDVFKAKKHIRCASDLARYWEEISNDRVPGKLLKAMQEDGRINRVLRDFGDLLADFTASGEVPRRVVTRGSVMCLPGGVIHAAPEAKKFRSILFFSMSPKGTPPYDPDTQVTALFLGGFLVQALWRKPKIEEPERAYLLHRFTHYIRNSEITDESKRVFPPGNLLEFVEDVVGYLNRGLCINDFIAAMAKASNMGPDVFGNQMHQGDFMRVSTADLFTLWEGKELEVEVHRRKLDGKVVLKYPHRGASKTFEVEGMKEIDNYRLVMDQGSEKSVFNGSNGQVLDTDGQLIRIYQKE